MPHTTHTRRVCQGTGKGRVTWSYHTRFTVPTLVRTRDTHTQCSSEARHTREWGRVTRAATEGERERGGEGEGE
jgi:hypothetical protein